MRPYQRVFPDVIDLTPELMRSRSRQQSNIIDLTLSDSDDESQTVRGSVHGISTSTGPSMATSSSTPSVASSSQRLPSSAPPAVQRTTPAAEPPRRVPASEHSKSKALLGKLKVKLEFEPKGFGEADIDDEVVEVSDPEKADDDEPLTGKKRSAEEAFDVDGDEEIQVLGGNMNFASNMPHPRESCTVHPFVNPRQSSKTSGNMQHCPNCYCYVCQVKADDCSMWDKHYNANCREPKWKQLRETLSASSLTTSFTQSQLSKYMTIINSLVEQRGQAPNAFNQYHDYDDDDDDYDDDDDDDMGGMFGRFPYGHMFAVSNHMRNNTGESMLLFNALGKCLEEKSVDGFAVGTALLVKLLTPQNSYSKQLEWSIIRWFVHPHRTAEALTALKAEIAKLDHGFRSRVEKIVGDVEKATQNPAMYLIGQKLISLMDLSRPCMMDLLKFVLPKLSEPQFQAVLAGCYLPGWVKMSLVLTCLELEGDKYVGLATHWLRDFTDFSNLKIPEKAEYNVNPQTLERVLLAVAHDTRIVNYLVAAAFPQVFHDVDSDAQVEQAGRQMGDEEMSMLIAALLNRAGGVHRWTDFIFASASRLRLIVIWVAANFRKGAEFHDFALFTTEKQPRCKATPNFDLVVALMANVGVRFLGLLPATAVVVPKFALALFRMAADCMHCVSSWTAEIEIEACRFPTVERDAAGNYRLGGLHRWLGDDGGVFFPSVSSLRASFAAEKASDSNNRLVRIFGASPSWDSLKAGLSGSLTDMAAAEPRRLTVLCAAVWKLTLKECVGRHTYTTSVRDTLLFSEVDFAGLHAHLAALKGAGHVDAQLPLLFCLTALLAMAKHVAGFLKDIKAPVSSHLLGAELVPLVRKAAVDAVAACASPEDLATLACLTLYPADAPAIDIARGLFTLFGRFVPWAYWSGNNSLLKVQFEEVDQLSMAEFLRVATIDVAQFCWEEDRRAALLTAAAKRFMEVVDDWPFGSPALPETFPATSFLVDVVGRLSPDDLELIVKRPKYPFIVARRIRDLAATDARMQRLVDQLYAAFSPDASLLANDVNGATVMAILNAQSISLLVPAIQRWIDQRRSVLHGGLPDPGLFVASILLNCCDSDLHSVAAAFLPILTAETSPAFRARMASALQRFEALPEVAVTPAIAACCIVLAYSDEAVRKMWKLCAADPSARTAVGDFLKAIEKSKESNAGLNLTLDVCLNGWENIVNDGAFEFVGKYKQPDRVLAAICLAARDSSPTLLAVMANQLALFAQRCLMEISSVPANLREKIDQSLGAHVFQGAYMQRVVDMHEGRSPGAGALQHTGKSAPNVSPDAAKLLLYALKRQPTDVGDALFVELRSWECFAGKGDRLCRLFLTDQRPDFSFSLMMSFRAMALFTGYLASLCCTDMSPARPFDFDRAAASLALLKTTIRSEHIHPLLSDVDAAAAVRNHVLQKGSFFMETIRGLCWLRLRGAAALGLQDQTQRYHKIATALVEVTGRLRALLGPVQLKDPLLAALVDLPHQLVESPEQFIKAVRQHVNGGGASLGFDATAYAALKTPPAREEAIATLLTATVEYFAVPEFPVSAFGVVKVLNWVCRMRELVGGLKAKAPRLSQLLARLVTSPLEWGSSGDDLAMAHGLMALSTATSTGGAVWKAFQALCKSHGAAAVELLERPVLVLALSYDPETTRQPFQMPLGNLIASKTLPALPEAARELPMKLLHLLCVTARQCGRMLPHCVDVFAVLASAKGQGYYDYESLRLYDLPNGWFNYFASLCHEAKEAQHAAVASILVHAAMFCLEQKVSAQSSTLAAIKCIHLLESHAMVNKMRLELVQSCLVAKAAAPLVAHLYSATTQELDTYLPPSKFWPPNPASPAGPTDRGGVNYAFYWQLAWPSSSRAADGLDFWTIASCVKLWLNIINGRPPYLIHTTTVDGLQIPSLATHSTASTASAAAEEAFGAASGANKLVPGAVDPWSLLVDRVVTVVGLVSSMIRNRTMSGGAKATLEQAIPNLQQLLSAFYGPHVPEQHRRRVKDEVQAMLRAIKSKKAVHTMMLVLSVN